MNEDLIDSASITSLRLILQHLEKTASIETLRKIILAVPDKSKHQKYITEIIKNDSTHHEYKFQSNKQNQINICISLDNEDPTIVVASSQKFMKSLESFPFYTKYQDCLFNAVCSTGNTRAARLMLKEYHQSVNINGYNFCSGNNRRQQFPLLSAAQNNNLDIIKLLLYYNADINQVSNIGNTILYEACCYNNSLDIKLINKCVDEILNTPELTNNNIHNSLLISIKRRQFQIFHFLIEKIRKIQNTKSKSNRDFTFILNSVNLNTYLYNVCSQKEYNSLRHVKFVKSLLEMNADPIQIVDSKNKTYKPRNSLIQCYYCCGSETTHIIIKTIINQFKVDKFKVDKFKINNLLNTACEIGSYEMVNILCNYIARFDIQIYYTPLQIALENGHFEIAKRLLRSRFFLNNHIMTCLVGDQSVTLKLVNPCNWKLESFEFKTCLLVLEQIDICNNHQDSLMDSLEKVLVRAIKKNRTDISVLLLEFGLVPKFLKQNVKISNFIYQTLNRNLCIWSNLDNNNNNNNNRNVLLLFLPRCIINIVQKFVCNTDVLGKNLTNFLFN